MNTFELLIVFAALMAVIALVAIAIDWVGRPLRHRRFIPRIFRYDDEMGVDLPVAGNVPMAATAARSVAAPPTPAPHHAVGAAPAPTQHRAPAAAPTPTVVATLTPGTDANSSIFSSAVAESARRQPANRTRDGVAQTVPVAPAPSWQPGMPLDARAGDRKPTAAVKAERFWRATAAALPAQSHFDSASRDQMAHGRPPTRHNPRSGETEAMELLGLRAASALGDVRMRWPDEAVDPWDAA